MRIPLLTLALCAAGASQAITGVVPNGYEAVDGNGTFLLGSTAAGGRTYQVMYAASQLTSFVGKNLNGLQFRLNGAATTNMAGVSFTDFNIFLGEGVDMSLRSLTFDSNYLSPKTQVRSGAFVINAGDYTGTPNAVEAFGPVISFSDYLYSGGNLVIELRYSSASNSMSSFDAVTSAAPGWGTDFGASWTGDMNGAAGGLATTNTFVMQLNGADAVPEPATMAILGLGAAALLRRKKKA